MKDNKSSKAQEESSMRDHLITVIQFNIVTHNLDLQSLYVFILSNEYKNWKRAGCYDDILATIVDVLGLAFELEFRGISKWRNTSTNAPITSLSRWEQEINDECKEDYRLMEGII